MSLCCTATVMALQVGTAQAQSWECLTEAGLAKCYIREIADEVEGGFEQTPTVQKVCSWVRNAWPPSGLG